MQEWILLELSDEVKCLMQDLQAEQEQGTQAQGWGWVACLQPVHLLHVH